MLLAYEDCQLLNVSGPLQVFASASELALERGLAGYRTDVVSRCGGVIGTTAGLAFVTRPRARIVLDRDTTLILPGGRGVHLAARDRQQVRWIRDHARAAERVCSVCTGAFLLAATGLLDGRRAVTHWKYCDLLADRFPRVTVERDPIFVRDERYWTSAGVAAGVDLALALVEADLGRSLALETARNLVVYLKRPGGQAQFSELLSERNRASHRFSALQSWVAANLRGELSVARLAQVASMSPRNFSRVFAVEMGTTPARMIERMRVEAARELFDAGRVRVSEVAAAVGFRDGETMRRAFIRQFGISPASYRQGFAARASPHAPEGWAGSE